MSVIAGVPADVEESGSFSTSSTGLVVAMDTPFRIRLFFRHPFIVGLYPPKSTTYYHRRY